MSPNAVPIPTEERRQAPLRHDPRGHGGRVAMDWPARTAPRGRRRTFSRGRTRGYQTNWLTITIGNKRYGLSRYRLYDFETGTFLSRDFLPYLNKYRAWSNNPVGQVDKDGLEEANEKEELPKPPTEEEQKEKKKAVDEGVMEVNKLIDKLANTKGAEMFELNKKYKEATKDLDTALRGLFYGVPVTTNSSPDTDKAGKKLGIRFDYEIGGLLPNFTYTQHGKIKTVVKNEKGEEIITIESEIFDLIQGVSGKTKAENPDRHEVLIKGVIETYAPTICTGGTFELTWGPGSWKAKQEAGNTPERTGFWIRTVGSAPPKPGEEKKQVIGTTGGQWVEITPKGEMRPAEDFLQTFRGTENAPAASLKKVSHSQTGKFTRKEDGTFEFEVDQSSPATRYEP